jgi:hypothetical protein
MATKTPAPPVLSPARKLLQEVLEAQGRAKALADKAAEVVDAANAALGEARAEVAKYNEANEDVVLSKLAALKGDPSAKSPEQLREARRSRHIAKEEVLEADQVLHAAQQELEEAQGNIARGHKVSASHATAVLSESASDVILAWDQVNQERERLRVILSALIMAPVHDGMPLQQQVNMIQGAVENARLPFGDAQDWKHLQNKVGAALSRNYAQPDPGPGIARGRAYWAQFADAILADPASAQAPLPGADVLFD